MLTQERLKHLLNYNPDTGEFIRLTRPTNSAKIGERFGYIQRGRNDPDYYRGKIDNKGYLLHRKCIQKWRADVGVNSKKVYLGDYATFQEAVDARLAAEKHYGYHENHGRQAA